MTALGLGDIAAFPFVEPPDRRQVNDGVALLEELGALDPTRARPAQAAHPARAPAGPAAGRPAAGPDGARGRPQRRACAEVLVIAAALSIQDPRERPPDQQQAADETHRRFADDRSDFLAYLNLWHYLQEQQKALSGSAFRRLCRTEFLHYLRVREWQDLVGQLRQVAKSARHQHHRRAVAARRRPAAGAHGAAAGPALARRPAGPGQARVRRRPRRPVRALAGVGAVQEAAALGDGRRAGRDLPAVGPRPRPDRAGVGRAAGRAPGQAHLQRAALVGASSGAAMAVRAGHAVRRAARGAAARSPTAGSTRRSRASCSSGTRWSRATGGPTTRSSTPTASCSRTSRSSSTGPAGATSWSTTRRCSTSTTSGCRPTSCPARHFDAWWKKARRDQPDLLTFDPAMLVRDDADAVSDARLPGRLAAGRARAAADLPVRAGRRRRRRDRARPAARCSTG